MIREAINNTLSRFVRTKPTNLLLMVTQKCNARCVMCNIWKEGVTPGPQLSLEQYGTLMADPLFSNVSSVVLSGGEALLRKDIVELAHLLLSSLPGLRRIMVATNGLATALIIRRLREMAAVMARRGGVRLTVQLSYDGVSEVHDAIRGPGAHEKVNRTLDGLLAMRDEFSFMDIITNCVIQPMNINEVERVAELMRGKGITPIFTVVCQSGHYYKNEGDENIAFSPEQLAKVKAILDKMSGTRHRLGKDFLYESGLNFLYHDFRNMLDGKDNSRACPALRDTMSIEPNGDVIPCLNAGDVPLGNILEKSPHEIWFSEKSAAVSDTVRDERCKSCMFACGVSHLEALKFTLFTQWRK